MVLNNNYVLEETEYLIYKCNKDVNDIITNMKLREAQILTNVNNLLNPKPKTITVESVNNLLSLLENPQIEGKYELDRSYYLETVNELETVQQVNHVLKHTGIIISRLKESAKHKPHIANSITKQCNWLCNEFKNTLLQKKVILSNNVLESGTDNDELLSYIQENELTDRILSHIPGGTLSTGRFDLLRPKLLKLAKKAKTIERINYLRKDLSIGKSQLKTLMKNKPEFKEQIEAHLEWVDTVYRQALNDRAKELKAAIKEAAIEEIVAIQENAKDNIMKVIDWLIEKVKEIWNRFFKGNVSREENAKWLTDNRDIILNKQYSGSKEIPEFWKNKTADGIINKFPKFDYSKMKPYLSSDDAFIKEYLQEIYDANKSYQDILKTKLYGDKNAVIKDNQMPIKDMFNYCTNGFKQRTKDLQNMHNSCISAAEQFKNDISNGKIQLESSVVFEKYFYSYLIESVLYEEDMGKDTNDNNTDNQKTNNQSDSSSSSDNKQEEQKKEEADQKKQDSQKALEAKQYIQKYININTNIKGIVMKCLDDTFDTYFAILKEHAIKNGAKYNIKKEKQDKNKDKK